MRLPNCYRCGNQPCTCADGCTIYCGDALEIVPLLNCETVITDPPYMIGSQSTGVEKSKVGGWGDQMNSAVWYSIWLEATNAIRSREGYIAVFGNWRSMAVYARAFSLAGLPMTSCLVWDKDWIGPAYENALRPTYELVVLSAAEQSQIKDRSVSDVYRCKWLAGQSRTTEHRAEKPVELLRHLVAHLSEPNWRVLDPFLGSGTTLRACKDLGRRGIGIEIEERYCEIAARRLEQGVLF